MNEKIKKGSELNLTIESLAYGGKGISKYNDIVIFTNNVLPGQKIKAKIIKKKKKYLEAILIEIVKESVFKQDEKCSHFYDCGGCKIQDLEYKQKLYKEALLEWNDMLKNLNDTELINFSKFLMNIEIKWNLVVQIIDGS